jgi:Flp pilus assembly protein TadG
MGMAMTPTFSMHQISQGIRRQRGAAAIEFALLFGLFFFVVYATISYAFVMAAQQALVYAATEGARVGTTKVDTLRFTTPALQQSEQKRIAKDAVRNALGWLPSSKRLLIDTTANLQAEWTTASTTINTGAGSLDVGSSVLTVTVTYPDYATNALVPMLNFPFFGTIPSVPPNLVGKAVAASPS